MLRRLVVGILLSSAVLALNACGRQQGPEESCNFVQNSSVQRVSWGEQTPIILYVDKSVPPEYFGAIEQAVEQWNSARGRGLIKIGGWINSSAGPARDGANVIYWLREWEADRPFEQARTSVYWAGDRIYETDIRVNEKNFDYAIGPVAGTVDIVSLMVHEIGHVLGLAHLDKEPSVMATSLANATERRLPTATDIQSLKCEY
ncbi:MAG: matrixin family metalloprotease [Bdellovibrionaceae bacterium]|nr:matrixin family metalloprotease [Pseudobdellovibrionaceae bacterium]